MSRTFKRYGERTSLVEYSRMAMAFKPDSRTLVTYLSGGGWSTTGKGEGRL